MVETLKSESYSLYLQNYFGQKQLLLVLSSDPLPLVGGARAPGASFLLMGRQVFVIAHGGAAPRFTAGARGR